MSEGDIAILPADLTVATFEPHVGDRFQLARDGHPPFEAELTVARSLDSVPTQVQFSLQFRAPLTAPVEQGIFRVGHPSLGSLDVFLVPIGRSEAGLVYEAVFNRLIPNPGGKS